PEPVPQWCCTERPSSPGPSQNAWDTTCAPQDPNGLTSEPSTTAAGHGLIDAGQTIRYTIHYENVGGVDAHDVMLLDPLPPEIDPATLAIEDGGSFDPASGLLSWVDPLVFPHDPRTVAFSASVRADAAPGTRVRNVATVIFPDASPPTRIDTNVLD